MSTHYFYTPHTDDETLGMAGAILRAQAAGDAVRVVLVTNNAPSVHMATNVFPDRTDLESQRISEFAAALRVLGVDEHGALDLPETRPELPNGLLHEMRARYAPDVVFHTVADEPNGTAAHAMCAQAAREFKRRFYDAEVILHHVYVYARPYEQRDTAGATVQWLAPKHWDVKRRALACYKSGIGYGYRSVPELFDGAHTDAREFIEVL